MRSVTIIASVFLFLAVLFFLYNAISALWYPFPLDYGEGLVVHYASLLRIQGTYFSDIHERPFSFAAYPPVVPVLISLIVGMTHAGGFFIARLLSLISTVGVVMLIRAILLLYSKQRWQATLFSFLFFVPGFVVLWSPLARVDLPALALSLAGLYCFLRYSPRQSSHRWWAILLFALAFFTKQHFLFAPLALFIFLILFNRRDALRFGVGFAVAVGLGCMALTAIFGGEWFLHLIVYSAAPLHFGDFLKTYLLFFSQTLFFLIPIGLWFRKKWSFYTAPLLIYLVLCLGAVALGAKVGANINYFLEPFASIIIVFGFFFIEENVANYTGTTKILLSLGLLFQVLCFALGYSFYRVSTPLDPGADRERRIVNSFVSGANSPVYIEDIGFAEIRGLEGILADPNQMAILSYRGLWNENGLLSYCETKNLNLVVVGKRTSYLPDFLRCLRTNYNLIGRTENYEFYRPFPSDRLQKTIIK